MLSKMYFLKIIFKTSKNPYNNSKDINMKAIKTLAAQTFFRELEKSGNSWQLGCNYFMEWTLKSRINGFGSFKDDEGDE